MPLRWIRRLWDTMPKRPEIMRQRSEKLPRRRKMDRSLSGITVKPPMRMRSLWGLIRKQRGPVLLPSGDRVIQMGSLAVRMGLTAMPVVIIRQLWATTIPSVNIVRSPKLMSVVPARQLSVRVIRSWVIIAWQPDVTMRSEAITIPRWDMEIC